MEDHEVFDGGKPAVDPAPEKPVIPTEVNPGETPEQTPEEKAQAEEERKRKTGSQRARERAERAEAKLAERDALIDRLLQGQKAPEEKPAPKPTTSADGRPLPPKASDFDDYDKYEAARDKYQEDLSDWKVDQRLKEKDAQTAQQQEEETLRDKIHKAHEAHPDLADLLDALDEEGIKPTDAMTRAIRISDVGDKLLLHLAKNPAETRRIGTLPLDAQTLELGMILGQIKAAQKPDEKPEPKTSQAPAPPKPIKGAAAPSQDPSKISDADFWKGLKNKRR